MKELSIPPGKNSAGDPGEGQNNEKPDTQQTAPIKWHHAFVEALQMELDAYSDVLEFHHEFQLTSEPLKIDCVVIKKAKDVVIKKNIAAIFREANILEYKSPTDYVSVPDFYKVYGYACLYAYLKNVPITSLTVSFVESHYPEKLLRHLKNVRSYAVEESSPGIYTVKGDILPIQVIDNRRLSVEENLWLKGLSDELKPAEYLRVNNEISRQGKDARIQAYLDVIIKANARAIMEVTKMSDELLTPEKALRAAGIADYLEERGKKTEALAIAKNLVNLGIPFETVVSTTRLDPEKVKELYQGTENS